MRGVLHMSATTSTSYARTAPVEALAEHIEHFWSVEWDLRGQPDLEPQTLPHPSVHVIIEGGKHEVSGVFTRRFVRALTGRGWVFGIKFRPAMFEALLGAPVSTLANRTVPLAEVFGPEGVTFARALAKGERISLTEAFFLPRLRQVDPDARRVRDVVERAAVDRSLLKVEQLASLAGVTVRTLERQFRRYVGVRPKWVLQRYRLHEAHERLKAEPHLELADLAAELGYVDQPHFVRDFKALVGVTPGAYARAVLGT